MSFEEKRRSKRYEADVPTRLDVSGRLVEVRLKDVCRDAVLVESPEAVALGTPVGVILGLPDGHPPIEIRGTVIRLAPAADMAVGLAVLFTQLSPELATRLDFFFATLE